MAGVAVSVGLVASVPGLSAPPVVLVLTFGFKTGDASDTPAVRAAGYRPTLTFSKFSGDVLTGMLLSASMISAFMKSSLF